MDIPKLATAAGRDELDGLVLDALGMLDGGAEPTYVIRKRIGSPHYSSANVLASCRRLERVGRVQNIGWRYGHANNFMLA